MNNDFIGTMLLAVTVFCFGFVAGVLHINNKADDRMEQFEKEAIGHSVAHYEIVDGKHVKFVWDKTK